MAVESERGLLGSLRSGLLRTSSVLGEGIRSIFQSGKKVDEETLKALRDLLISTDMGYESAACFTQKVAELKFCGVSVHTQVKERLAEEIEGVLSKVQGSFSITNKPHIIMMCGTNGSGKTTTVAKLARKFQKEGKTVLVGACDTFRAAAVEQLQVLTDRIACPMVAGASGADAASVAYQVVHKAITTGVDVVLIDTAGRLQNHRNLMEELAKICRTVSKHDSSAPHDTILVLDATIGQNAFNQVKTFSSFVNVSGMIMTKLDGTAKGGIVLRIAQEYRIRLCAVGVGEGLEDLKEFCAREFSRNLLGI